MKKPKFSGINKRHLTLMGMVVVIAIAGYVNVNYKKTDAVQTMSTIKNDENIQKNDEYTNAIMERDSKRSESMQVYRDIINNSDCDKETKENAQKMLTLSAEYINAENKIQESLKAKGFEKSVLYIDKNEITAIIYDKKLDGVSVSQIKDIISGVSGFSAEKIKIIENK
jgi:stage III sporulation protein AH